MNNIITKIKNWYRGKYIPQREDGPNGSVTIREKAYYEKPPLAKFIEIIFVFWSHHWQWLLTFALGMIGSYIAYLKL
jgi:hypothetical protein